MYGDSVLGKYGIKPHVRDVVKVGIYYEPLFYCSHVHGLLCFCYIAWEDISFVSMIIINVRISAFFPPGRKRVGGGDQRWLGFPTYS